MLRFPLAAGKQRMVTLLKPQQHTMRDSLPWHQRRCHAVATVSAWPDTFWVPATLEWFHRCETSASNFMADKPDLEVQNSRSPAESPLPALDFLGAKSQASESQRIAQ